MKKIGLTKGSIALYIITLISIVVGDQVTKILVSSSMQLSTSHTIIDNFFYFTYIHNKGAAWGMLEGRIYLFLLFALIAAVGMIYYFSKTKKEEALTRYGLVLVFAGMIGNVIDRVAFGYVRDFLDFYILGYDFPVFNIADMAVVLGVGIMIFEIIVGEYGNGKRKH